MISDLCNRIRRLDGRRERENKREVLQLVEFLRKSLAWLEVLGLKQSRLARVSKLMLSFLRFE